MKSSSTKPIDTWLQRVARYHTSDANFSSQIHHNDRSDYCGEVSSIATTLDIASHHDDPLRTTVSCTFSCQLRSKTPVRRCNGGIGVLSNCRTSARHGRYFRYYTDGTGVVRGKFAHQRRDDSYISSPLNMPIEQGTDELELQGLVRDYDEAQKGKLRADDWSAEILVDISQSQVSRLKVSSRLLLICQDRA